MIAPSRPGSPVPGLAFTIDRSEWERQHGPWQPGHTCTLEWSVGDELARAVGVPVREAGVDHLSVDTTFAAWIAFPSARHPPYLRVNTATLARKEEPAMPLTLTPTPDTSTAPQAFWLVWRSNGGPPTVRHASYDKAQAEAERLAAACPGETFYVLEAMAEVRKPPPVMVRHMVGGSGLPF